MVDYKGLNQAQRLAVTHGKGPLLLLAGPGSGKTFTITQRILYLLEQGVVPEQLLVITFTRDAALSMQRRFCKLSRSNFPVNFGTFHSIFYHILTESDKTLSRRILTLSQKKKMLLPILKKYSGDVLQEDTVSILAAMSYYKNTLCLAEAVGKVPGEWQERFEEIFSAYEESRKRQKALDFDDMVCQCRELLMKNQAKRLYWQNRFEHILMDEFQDINPIQYETVKLLAKPPCNLFAVGDDDQAIYGFRGSRPECLKRFEQELGARSLLLNVNYRSCKEIIDASGRVISENKDRFEKKILPRPDESGKGGDCGGDCGRGHGREAAVLVKGFENAEEQYRYLMKRLKVLSENASGGNISDMEETCAVLFRTNVLMQRMAARLGREGIPYVMKEKVQNIYEHFIVRDIMAYLTLAKEGWNREAFLRIMNRPSRYISREALGGCDSLKRLAEQYKAAGAGNQYDRLKELERQLTRIRDMSLGLAVTYICRAVGYEGFLRKQSKGHPDRWEEWREMLEWVKLDAGRASGLGMWKEEQEAFANNLEQGEEVQMKRNGQRDKEDSVKGRPLSDGAIRLMTVHASKGLEFHRVFIPDCNEGVFPHGKMPDINACEEERRVFYVAMTRAAKSLELLYVDNTDKGSRPPSRFLNPLMKRNTSVRPR